MMKPDCKDVKLKLEEIDLSQAKVFELGSPCLRVDVVVVEISQRFCVICWGGE